MSKSSAAVCITGLQRSLLDMPIVGSFNEHVRGALVASGAWHVDTHIAIVSEPKTKAVPTWGQLRHQLEVSYKPVSFNIVPFAESEQLRPSRRCRAVHTARTFENKKGEMSVLRQWVAIGGTRTNKELTCVRACQRDFSTAGASYSQRITEFTYLLDFPRSQSATMPLRTTSRRIALALCTIGSPGCAPISSTLRLFLS